MKAIASFTGFRKQLHCKSFVGAIVCLCTRFLHSLQQFKYLAHDMYYLVQKAIVNDIGGRSDLQFNTYTLDDSSVPPNPKLTH